MNPLASRLYRRAAMAGLKAHLVRYLEAALLARRPSAAQRAALALARVARPGVLETREPLRRHMVEGIRVSVRAWGDDDPDQYRRLRLGDTWLRHGLLVALGRAGCIVTDVDPDVVIHLHGRAVDLPRRAFRILWVHSHPETVTSASLASYDHVFCASRAMAERVRALGRPASVLELATAARPVTDAVTRHSVVFVGNARVDGRRAVLEDIGTPDFPLAVWGAGYEALPANAWQGDCLEYHELPSLYAGSTICLNDHLPSMAACGIVNPRVYDVLASGGFCISDANPGLDEVFGDAVPQYRSPAELHELIHHFLADPERRRPLMKKGQEIALKANWADRARVLLEAAGRGPGEPSLRATAGARSPQRPR
ncbi:MAG: glycosyltransferase [Vicinamibacteria bacterium]|nr:glycosyltransferase [Vicinamibacteria bacterium]